MADDIFSSEDFDKLLDDFIATQLQDTEDSLAEMNEKSQKNQPAESANKDTAEKEENTESNENFSVSQFVEEAQNSNINKLAKEEKRLFEAYTGLINAAKSCGEAAEIDIPEFVFDTEDLLPRFRPSKIRRLNDDILACWDILIKAQPIRLSSLPSNASDEQILSFAEKTTDQNLQMALISYVETLIELDGCEIAYNLRKAKYEKHKIEKRIYEEQMQRREKISKYIEAIRAKNFPVDADMLVNNFFKTVRKDPEGAQKILENNPATYAPIQFDKIPARFFGMIKPKPEDGIKINKKLGKFLKNLKV